MINLSSGLTALILGLLFIFPVPGMIMPPFGDGTNDWFSSFQNNWLIVIYKLHAGLISIQEDPLRGLNGLDIVIMSAFSITCLGLYINLKRISRIWSIIAYSFSLIAIVLFIITQSAGRSTLMLSILIFSFVMLKDKRQSKVTIYAGIVASIFLFAGDLTVGMHSKIITILFCFGYLLLIVWFFLISRTLIHIFKILCSLKEE
ncbi:MAG: hypothetical protein ACM3NR_02675 [Methanosarcina sp.]